VSQRRDTVPRHHVERLYATQALDQPLSQSVGDVTEMLVLAEILEVDNGRAR
jgi:hypothetical protein